MKQKRESYRSESEFSPENLHPDAFNFSKMGNIAFQAASESEKNKENIDRRFSAIDLVQDHFPESITSEKHFEQDSAQNPLATEEDYERTFSAFEQKEFIPRYNSAKDEYLYESERRPFRETVDIYLRKTKNMIKKLSGEDGKNPATDVAIYLDKSARPVSWFVNDLWDVFSDKPMPITKHLAIDRTAWFDEFGIEIGFGEYKDNNVLAGWEDIPIRNVTTEDIIQLKSIFEQKIVSFEDAKLLRDYKDSKISYSIKGNMIDAVFRENGINGNESSNEIDAILRKNGVSDTNAEFDRIKKLGIDKAQEIISILENQNIWKAFQIASQIRALFLPGGITEEEMRRPDLIMSRETGLAGKNITIIDEVERTGTTRKIATHFISWAFPEAANVRSEVFYEAKTLTARTGHPQDGQMLRIPFWYSLEHDDGAGRGIHGIDRSFYENMYNNNPDDLKCAAMYGSNFLGTRIDYREESGQKSLRLREQIARLRFEVKKGRI